MAERYTTGPEFTVGLLGVKVPVETMDLNRAQNLRLDEIERRILAIEARFRGE